MQKLSPSFVKEKIVNISLRWKILILLMLFSNIVVLIVGLNMDGYRKLMLLFFYSFFSNAPISWVAPLMPQEPALLMYGAIYAPWLVAMTAGIATFNIELINYQILVPICNLEKLKAYRKKRFYIILERYFNLVPFLVIVFVGFTPVPHLPFRLLSVLTGYNIVKYAFASFLGRTSFYYIMALTGTFLHLPYWVYIAFLLVIIVIGLIIGLHSRKKMAN